MERRLRGPDFQNLLRLFSEELEKTTELTKISEKYRWEFLGSKLTTKLRKTSEDLAENLRSFENRGPSAGHGYGLVGYSSWQARNMHVIKKSIVHVYTDRNNYQPQPPFYGHYTGQPALASTSS